MKKWKKVISSIGIVIFVLIAALLAYLPYYITNPFVDMHVDYEEVSWQEFEIDIETIKLETEDGLKVVVYENHIEEARGTVIMISGIHNPSVTAFYNHSELLGKNGYSSILLETRAHGESEGELIGLGYLEALDVKAVVDYIKGKNSDEKIAVWGYSMGGAIAINSIGQISEVDALISMSAFSSWEQVLSDYLVNMGVPTFIANLTKPFTKLYTWGKYGFDRRSNIASKQIKNLGDRPGLIVHSKGDNQVPFASYEKIIENAPETIETWVLEGNRHMILEDWNLELEENREYVERVLGFLESNLK